MFHRGLFAVVITFLTLAGSSLALAQPRPAAAAEAKVAAANDALLVHSGGLEALLVDPKDQGVLKALRMIDQRVLELPGELHQAQMPAAAMQLVIDLLTGPMTLRAGMLSQAEMQAMQNQPGGGPPFYAQINFLTKDANAAQTLAGRLSGTMASMGAPPSKPAPAMPGFQVIDAHGAPMYLGTFKGESSGVAVGLNRVDPSEPAFGETGLPKGVTPAFVFDIDYRQLQPVMEMFAQHAGPEGEQALNQLRMMGLYGPDAANLKIAVGHGPDRAHMAMRYVNYKRVMEQVKGVASGSLSAADLKRIPADATYAQITKFNLNSFLHGMEQMAQQQQAAAGGEGGAPPDPMAMIEQQTGINPQRDVFDHLGETMGLYMSDTTGAGGILSSVAFIEVKNPEGLANSISRMRGMANQLGQQFAKGYVRWAERSIDGVNVQMLTFPGLPIPIEVGFAIADGWLYAAPSTQGLLAAIKHAKSGTTSLADNAHFKEMAGDFKGAIQVSFIDTPRLVPGGYGLVSLGVAALANAVRSPVDVNREPGLIMPPLPELMKGAKASVMVSKLEGDDLVTTGQWDRSMLVNACGTVGMIGGSPAAIGVAALMAGVTLPALHKAREAAVDVKAAAQLRQIGTAMMVYAADNKDALPKSTQVLIDQNILFPEILDSPAGDADQGPDFWVDSSGVRLGSIQNPMRRILGYDRAMYDQRRSVNVLYADGHVEKLTFDAFNQAVQDVANQGVDFALPGHVQQ